MKRLGWYVLLLAVAVDSASFAQTNIDPAHKFCWGENIGWANWADANGGTDGVIVDTTGGFLSGYVWGENVGWINAGDGAGPYANTDGTNFGLNILGDDDLDGFAWGENIGWVNFGWGAAGDLADRARWDGAAERFRGYAWGENVGWINLDDATHYVAVLFPCLVNDDCDDSDTCTQDACTAGSCANLSRLFGDVNNDGTVDIFDILCVLDGFAGVFNPPCTLTNLDLSGCPGGDGVIDIFDILGVLDGFAGVNVCGCPAGP
ncbi:MAG: hypothetical protein HOP29_12095 [Phycisphaerales bacterium]|nr:hypothetical protein [Phycisphaerales bacterium]